MTPMAIGVEGCPCCESLLHHCKNCWDKYHNGLRDNDYVPPAYYGESLFNLDEWESERYREAAMEYMPIKPDKNRPYIEGEYQHEG